MVSVIAQRDLILKYKKETSLNVRTLSKLHSLPQDLEKIFVENALEKPTQNLFNHLTHYLICIIDPQAGVSMAWPLYDSKNERVYRNEVSAFINEYSGKGLLSPVMSSYLVNPGCYKVTLLMLQLSQLAMQKVLMSKMNEQQRELYNDVTDTYKSPENDVFMEKVERETVYMRSKVTHYILNRKAMEGTAELMRKKISEMNATLLKTNAQEYLDNLVNGFINTQSLDDNEKLRLEQIKYVQKPAPFFDEWLANVDMQITNMETKWSEKVSPFLELAKKTQINLESLISRQTGQADANTYIIEYNQETDEICTKDLQNQVNNQQKYILKNIVKDEILHFPNLIRSFLIAISFVLKNTEIGDEIYKFNEYLEGGERNYHEMLKTLKNLVVRVMNAETKLQPSPLNFDLSIPVKDIPKIPPLPDLSGLYCTKELQCQALFDAFTPLSTSKHQFNLQGKNFSFTNPHPRPELLVNPFFNKPKENFMRINNRVTYDYSEGQSYHNITVSSNRLNETISECSTAFTKQQMVRLLSTKKSSLKKIPSKVERSYNIKRGGLFNESHNLDNKKGLFNESISSTESLFRSYSSPNLFEQREMRNVLKAGQKKLSIMEENSPISLNLSGITAIDKDSSCETSQSYPIQKRSNIPVIVLNNDQKFHNNIKDFRLDLNKILDFPEEEIPKKHTQVNKTSPLSGNLSGITPIEKDSSCEISQSYLARNLSLIPTTKLSDDQKFHNNIKDFKLDLNKVLDSPEEKIVTPKTTQVANKTSSLEKLISRYRKIRANVKTDENDSGCHTITEEKENLRENIQIKANRVLLPDLLGPNPSVISKSPMDDVFKDFEENITKKSRQSLGTALGVDETFLDQFALVDD